MLYLHLISFSSNQLSVFEILVGNNAKWILFESYFFSRDLHTRGCLLSNPTLKNIYSRYSHLQITIEWVSDCCWTRIQQFFRWERINFHWDDDVVRFVLDQHAELDFYSASSLKQQNACRHVAPIGHIILIPSHPVFALSRYAVCLAEKQQIPIL
jgi:hypothetical protein